MIPETENIPEPLPSLPETVEPAELKAQQRKTTIIIIAIALVVLLIIVGSFILLMRAPALAVAQLRDVFIIYLALQSLLIGLVLVIVMIQLARLINLLNNEIMPILESTNETISNLRGTTTFLSDNLVEPVIRLNEYMAGIVKLMVILGISRKRK
jgi:membrane protein implicated in regulation of membrane protease activity